MISEWTTQFEKLCIYKIIRVDDAVPEQPAVVDGIETLQQQYQRADQYQVVLIRHSVLAMRNTQIDKIPSFGNDKTPKFRQ